VKAIATFRISRIGSLEQFGEITIGREVIHFS
jgi:hypothetical protein